MPQEYVENDIFLTRVESAFKTAASEETKGGTVWLTHKRYSHGSAADSSNSKQPQEDVDMDETDTIGKEYDVLIRCTNGSDINFATRIPPSLLSQFHAHYSSLLKFSLSPSMIKRDKKKEKMKAEKKESWKKGLYEDVPKLDGKKVGGGKVGHRQRKRRLEAQRRKEAQREELEERERTSKPAI